MRLVIVLVVVSQSVWAQPFPRERLAKLLGLPSIEKGPRPADPPVASPLPCQVLGTLRSRVDALSVATVQCGKDKAHSFHVGDLLIEDALVQTIGHGVVTVLRAGRLEELGRGVVVAALAPLRAVVQEGRVPRTLVDELMRDPARMLGEAAMMPAITGGKWTGVRATWVKEGGIAATLGLKRGDVVTAVNGKTLDSVQNALAVLQTMGTTREVDVELLRDGQAMTKRVRIE